MTQTDRQGHMNLPEKYKYALPLEKLIARYKGALDSLKNGKCATIVGLPHDSKGGCFRSLIEDSEEVRKDLGVGNLYFLFLNVYTGEYNPSDYQTYLLSAFLELPEEFSGFKKGLRQSLKEKDMASSMSLIVDLVKGLEDGKRIVLVIFGLEETMQSNPEYLKYLIDLHKKTGFNTGNKLCILTIGYLHTINNENITPIDYIIRQTIFYNKFFDNEELDYVRKRFELLGFTKVTDNNNEIAKQLSGSHYYLYKTLLKESELIDLSSPISEIYKIPSIRQQIRDIYDDIKLFTKDTNPLENKILEQIGVVKNGEYSSPLLTYHEKLLQKDLNTESTKELTPREIHLLDYLKKHINQVITKEDIAKEIWGEKWTENYSIWALDKTISRLKNKLSNTDYSILVIKERGIKLITNADR